MICEHCKTELEQPHSFAECCAGLLARISELEDTIDLTEAEDLIASSYGRNTDACVVAEEIHWRRGSNWTGALTSRELARSR